MSWNVPSRNEGRTRLDICCIRFRQRFELQQILEIFAPVGYYAASSGKSLPTIRVQLNLLVKGPDP